MIINLMNIKEELNSIISNNLKKQFTYEFSIFSFFFLSIFSQNLNIYKFVRKNKNILQ